mgnify:CR=1 FL=1
MCFWSCFRTYCKLELQEQFFEKQWKSIHLLVLQLLILLQRKITLNTLKLDFLTFWNSCSSFPSCQIYSHRIKITIHYCKILLVNVHEINNSRIKITHSWFYFIVDHIFKLFLNCWCRIFFMWTYLNSRHHHSMRSWNFPPFLFTWIMNLDQPALKTVHIIANWPTQKEKK